jgi:hypothetical protein
MRERCIRGSGPGEEAREVVALIAVVLGFVGFGMA